MATVIAALSQAINGKIPAKTVLQFVSFQGNACKINNFVVETFVLSFNEKSKIAGVS